MDDARESMNVYREFLKREDCVLVLVDIQKLLLDPCEGADRLAPNVTALIEVAQMVGIPILCSEQNPDKLGGFLPDLVQKLKEPRVLSKVEFNCFENADIAWALSETNRRTLLMAGLEAHVCVFHTAACALRLGYRVHVASDAVASRSLFNRSIGLGRMEKAGAVISSTEMIIYELLTRAGTPEFRAALPTLKTL
jgi:nicotinamidase-related amidase